MSIGKRHQWTPERIDDPLQWATIVGVITLSVWIALDALTAVYLP